jgi:hypothetical protein
MDDGAVRRCNNTTKFISVTIVEFWTVKVYETEGEQFSGKKESSETARQIID